MEKIEPLKRYKLVPDANAAVEDPEGEYVLVPFPVADLQQQMAQLTLDMDRLRRSIVRQTLRSEVI